MKKLPKHKKPDPILLTEEAYKKAKNDYKRLKKEEADVLVRLNEAREKGDLSENGAYKYAKFELGKVRRQLGEVNNLLRYGVVKKTSNQGIVEFGSKVTVEVNDMTLDYLIVSKHETNPMQKKISTDSPLGKVLIGKKAGDSVTMNAPAGEIEYKIIKVE